MSFLFFVDSCVFSSGLEICFVEAAKSYYKSWARDEGDFFKLSSISYRSLWQSRRLAWKDSKQSQEGLSMTSLVLAPPDSRSLFILLSQVVSTTSTCTSELPITNNGGGKPWNLSDSGAICHRLACNRKNRWDQHILILGLKVSGILDYQERLRLKRLGKSWGSKLCRWCISWSSKNGCLDSYILSRKSMLWLLKNTIWDPIKTFGRPVQILANILGK